MSKLYAATIAHPARIERALNTLEDAIAIIRDCYETERGTELIARARERHDAAINLAAVLLDETDDDGMLHRGVVSQQRIAEAEMALDR